MTMENDFRAIFADDPAVKVLVGVRLFPGTYAQATTDPAIRYQKITGAPGLHMRGSDGLSSDLFQIDVRAATAQSALDVKDAIVAKLHAYRGVKGGTDFRVISLRNDRGVSFEKTDAKSYYTASLDFDVWSRTA